MEQTKKTEEDKKIVVTKTGFPLGFLGERFVITIEHIPKPDEPIPQPIAANMVGQIKATLIKTLEKFK